MSHTNLRTVPMVGKGKEELLVGRLDAHFLSVDRMSWLLCVLYLGN